MKNWKSIFATLAAVSAISFASAQEETPVTQESTTVPTDGGAATATVAETPSGVQVETLEMKTKNGLIKAEKTVDGDSTKVKITVGGINSQSGIEGIIQDLKKAGDTLAGTTPVGASAPRGEDQDDPGGVRGRYSTIIAGKEISNSKLTITAQTHSIPADITAAELAEDFMNVIAQTLIEEQVAVAGKTVVMNVTFAPGTDPVITFVINVPDPDRETWGQNRIDEPDNTINIDDSNITNP